RLVSPYDHATTSPKRATSYRFDHVLGGTDPTPFEGWRVGRGSLLPPEGQHESHTGHDNVTDRRTLIPLSATVRNGPGGRRAAPTPHRSRAEELVEEFNYPQSAGVTATPGPTPSQTVGPFFHYALPYESGPAVVGPQRHGAFRLSGRVLDGQGEPIPDSLVEV